MEVLVNKTFVVLQADKGALKSGFAVDIVFPQSTVPSVISQTFDTVNFIVKFLFGQLLVL